MTAALAAVPPGTTLASINAEKTILGAVVVEPSLIATVLLDPSEFGQASYRAVYRAMRALDAAHRIIDTVTLTEQLQRAGDFSLVGGDAALAALVDGMPRLDGVEEWQAIVREAATKRRLVEIADRIASLARGDASASDALEEGARLLQDTAARCGAIVDLDADAQLREAVRALEDSAKGEAAGGWSMGLPSLDRYVGRLVPGQLVIVAGRTGLGKSTVLQNAADAIASQGAGVLMFSAEMTAKEINVRRLLAEANVPASHFETGGIQATEREWERVVRAVSVLRERPVFVDAHAPTPLEARAKARIVMARRGLACVCFDYLQLMPAGAGRKGETREAEVARVSRALKRLAMDLGVVVIAASQLNRQADNRKDGKPRLTDLRESGAQEQDADVVLLLHRADDGRDDELELQVAKHRNRGRSPWIKLAFDGSRHRLAEMDGPR